AGMDDFISKPIVIAQLEKALDRWATAQPAEVVIAAPPSYGVSPSSYSREYVWRNFGGDANRIRELISLLRHDLRRYADRLADRVRAGELSAVQELAHTIKSSAGNAGGTDVAAAAGAIDQAAGDGATALLPACCQKLEIALAVLMRDLSVWDDEL